MILLEPNENGPLKICAYYAKANEVTVTKSDLLLRMKDCIDSLEEAMIFLILNANSGY